MHLSKIPYFLLLLIFIPAVLIGQPCKSKGIDDQEISITWEGKFTSYSGLAFELQLSSQAMVQFEALLPDYLFKYTNQYRQEHGLPPLRRIKAYEQAAFSHCNYLLTESDKKNLYTIGHGQDDQTNKFYTGYRASDRATYYSGKEETCGENCLYSWLEIKDFDVSNLEATVDKVAYNMVYDSWHNSPGHRENMLRPTYKSLGCAGTIRTKITKDRFMDCAGKVKEFDEIYSWYMLYATQVFGVE